MDEKLSIKINIAGKFFPLKISLQEEEAIRKAAKLINDKLTEYRQKYAQAEISDLLSMTALHFATQYIEAGSEGKFDELTQEIENINNDLNEYISQNKRLV
jgi:cell division protein ZapA